MMSLIIPPVSDCFMPTLGAAQLVGFLKQQGIQSKLYDLSAELQNLICKVENINNSPSLTIYKQITQNLFTLDNDGFQLSFDNFISRWNWRRPDTYDDLVVLHKKFLQYLKALPSMKEILEAQYVGFSVSFECQLIPSLLIASILKEKNKEIKIIMGGSLFYNYFKDVSKILYSMNIIDCIVVGTGEKVLLAIARKGLKSLDTIAKKCKGRYLIDTTKDNLQNDTYIPDFSDIDFSKYFSAVHAFPYMINSICYYGKCKFCNGDRNSNLLQNKNIELAIRDIFSLLENTGINNVYIVDAALSPSNIKKIANMSMCKRFNWIANARFERLLDDYNLVSCLRGNGCRMLRFGFETASQKILDSMNKGTNISIAESILRKTHKAGILNHLYIMFGYWHETDEDRTITLEFLERNKNYIDSYSISIFQPIPNTHVYGELLKEIQTINPSLEQVSYEHIISILYPSEEYYSKIMKYVEEVKKILHSYARTNEEYYSANIFNDVDVNMSETDISIQFTPKDKILQ